MTPPAVSMSTRASLELTIFEKEKRKRKEKEERLCLQSEERKRMKDGDVSIWTQSGGTL